MSMTETTDSMDMSDFSFPTEAEAKKFGFPLQAIPREKPWIFVGWIKHHHGPKFDFELSFEDMCAKAQQSDHGETREIDSYPEGAVCWYKERGT